MNEYADINNEYVVKGINGNERTSERANEKENGCNNKKGEEGKIILLKHLRALKLK
jgi:hypothetical protein